MAETAEYDIIHCVQAGADPTNAAVEEYKDAFEKSVRKPSQEGWVSLGKFGMFTTALFHFGADLSRSKFIIDRCGPYEEAEKDTVIMSMVENEQQLQPWKILPGKVLVVRPVNHELSANVGFPKCFKGSHRMQTFGEIIGAPEEELRIGLNQMLIIDGDVVIRFPKFGGGICMIQGIMKK